MLVTNQKDMVKCAKICYEKYPTIVNALKESGISYKNTKEAYANMDNKFSGSQMGIGWSSNLAQLAMTYYWTELSKEHINNDNVKLLYDNFVILSVIAQVIIDNSKREYEINGDEEIKRISKLPCMNLYKEIDGAAVKQDFPIFMKYTREIKHTKDGKELPAETVLKNRNKLKNRINQDLQCPMNWLEEWLDKIQNIPSTNSRPTKDFFIKMNGKANSRQMSKIRKLIEEYDGYIKHYSMMGENDSTIVKIICVTNSIVEQLQKIKIGNPITVNRLIETAFGIENANNNPSIYRNATKYTRKTLNLLYKMDKDKFLNNFVC